MSLLVGLRLLLRITMLVAAKTLAIIIINARISSAGTVSGALGVDVGLKLGLCEGSGDEVPVGVGVGDIPKT